MANQDVMSGETANLQPCMDFQDALLREKRGVAIAPAMITQFFNHLDAIFAQNTRQNIQTCTEWILKHIAPSGTRTILLGKYLVSLSESIAVNRDSGQDKAIRNRLDLVLVISDVLHAVKFHQPSENAVAKDLYPYIKELMASVASCCHERNTKHERRLKAVIKLWFTNGMFDMEDISDIMESARNSLRTARGDAAHVPRKRNDNLPTYFGDSNALEYDLPTSYVLLGNPRRNWRGEPSGMQSQKLPRQPSRKTTELLDAYFEKLDALYRPTGDNPLGGTGGYKQWTDATGHPMTQHKTTSSLKKISNGLGWSMDVCKNMTEEGVIANVSRMREGRITSRVDLDGQVDDNERKTRHYDSDRSRSPRRRRYSSSGSDYDRSERRRDGRSLSRSSIDSRHERSSSRRNDRRSAEGDHRSRSNDRRYDDRRPDPRGSDQALGHHRPPPSITGSFPRESTYPTPSQPQIYPTSSQGPSITPAPFQQRPPPPPPPPQFPGHFPGPFPGQVPGQTPPGHFQGPFQSQPPPPFPPQFSGPPPGQFPGPFPGQFQGQFNMPPFPFPVPGGPPASQPGQPNFPAFPNPDFFPGMNSVPNFDGSAGANNPQTHGGFNRGGGGFRGNNFGGRGAYPGHNQRGRGGPGWH